MSMGSIGYGAWTTMYILAPIVFVIYWNTIGIWSAYYVLSEYRAEMTLAEKLLK